MAIPPWIEQWLQKEEDELEYKADGPLTTEHVCTAVYSGEWLALVEEGTAHMTELVNLCMLDGLGR